MEVLVTGGLGRPSSVVTVPVSLMARSRDWTGRRHGWLERGSVQMEDAGKVPVTV
ncbi:hypothetical protein GCM10010177_78550 [Actinomadura citrea]|nr:hypothetical protein GCM10010177_78550 [Actinomadura citrea]